MRMLTANEDAFRQRKAKMRLFNAGNIYNDSARCCNILKLIDPDDISYTNLNGYITCQMTT